MVANAIAPALPRGIRIFRKTKVGSAAMNQVNIHTTTAMGDIVLKLTCFVGGFVIMSLETLGFRLLAPHFGTSVYVSGSLLGVVMLALSVGYFWGGKLADKYPTSKVLYLTMGVTSFWLLFLIVFHRKLLVAIGPLGIIEGSLLSTIIVLGIPLVPLSMVSPYIIRILVTKGHVGATAGTIYSISTVGSLAGVFVTTFLLIPHLGVKNTIAFNYVFLILSVLVGLIQTGRQYGLLIFLLPLCGLPEMKTPDPDLIAEKESLYSNIQVRHAKRSWYDKTPVINLKINEGGGQSRFDPHAKYPYENSYIAKITLLPFILEEPPQKLLMLGLGGGTLAIGWRTLFPSQIDLVEIDPQVVAFAHQYFNFVADPKMRIFEEDARQFLQKNTEKYDFIAIDTYNGANAPYHLSTLEFFQEIKQHLSKNGVVAMNLAYPFNGTAKAVARVLKSVFPKVFVITDFPGSFILIGASVPWNLDHILRQLKPLELTYSVNLRDERKCLWHALRGIQMNTLEFQDNSDTPVLTDDRSNFEDLYFGAVVRISAQYRDLPSREQLLQEGLRDWPSPEMKMVEAWVLISHKKRERARALLEKLGEIDEGNSYSYIVPFLGEQYVYEGRLEQAEEILKRGLEIWPEQGELHGNLGVVYLRQGQVSRAIPLLEKAATKPDARSLLMEALGDAYTQMKQSDKARNAYRKAEELLTGKERDHALSGFVRSSNRLQLTQKLQAQNSP